MCIFQTPRHLTNFTFCSSRLSSQSACGSAAGSSGGSRTHQRFSGSLKVHSTHLLGGWTNLVEKYATVQMRIFHYGRGENKKYLDETTTYSKYPFFNGCLVISNHFLSYVKIWFIIQLIAKHLFQWMAIRSQEYFVRLGLVYENLMNFWMASIYGKRR